ncbi:MAG: DNA repair protein RecN, partial [Chitinophagaceae bacterium]
MLQKLYIRNYAIIHEVTIPFPQGLNIITGETGAGKSILMGALSLILGERADTSVLVDATQKCLIEGYFLLSTAQNAITAFLTENDIEQEEELIIRREIAPSGKSRAFINDTPATLQQLKQLTALLVDLHRQFDTQEVGNEHFQRMVIDALAGNKQLLTTYQQHFKLWQKATLQLQQLQQQKLSAEQALELYQFQFQELEALQLVPDKIEQAEAELELLSNAEGVKTGLSAAYFHLYESEMPLVQVLKQTIQQLQPYQQMHSGIADLLVRLQQSQVELLDIAQEVDKINDGILFDAQRIQELNDWLSACYKLYKKHKVNSTAELITIAANLQQQLSAITNIDEAIEAAAKHVAAEEAAMLQLGKQLTQQRTAQLPGFEQKVTQLLAQVGMPNARLQVQLQSTQPQLYGLEQIAFLFDANKSNRFEPLYKVASGGELSRLMLCIKSLVA